MMSWLELYNKEKSIRVFYFQYAAVLADIADFMTKYVDIKSHFFYGKNAKECLKYMAVREKGQNETEFLDELTEQLCKDTGNFPYNIEDVACDCIRWIENYINPKTDYSHLDMDKVFSSCNIKNHHYGRQKMMLELGLVETFNGMSHPSDDKILKQKNITLQEYEDLIIFK